MAVTGHALEYVMKLCMDKLLLYVFIDEIRLHDDRQNVNRWAKTSQTTIITSSIV